jgi:hypothetical protein
VAWQTFYITKPSPSGSGHSLNVIHSDYLVTHTHGIFYIAFTSNTRLTMAHAAGGPLPVSITG